MNVTTKRQFASRLLLAVFLPMLLLSALHLHQPSASALTSCTECVQHHCSGHLAQQSGCVHDCVLCQFLTLPLLAVVGVTLLIYNNVSKILFAQRQGFSLPCVCGTPLLRAPPSV